MAFVEVDDVNGKVDAAYRAKYDRYGSRYVGPMLAEQAQAATLELVPR